jgi:hypothetical protein
LLGIELLAPMTVDEMLARALLHPAVLVDTASTLVH